MNNNRIEAARKAEEAHKHNLQRNIEKRLEAAKAKGDENLVRQLEAEQAYYE